MVSAVATLLVLAITLSFWRSYFEFTDWSAVALMVLAVPIAVGNYVIAVQRRRAIMQCALTTGSRLQWLAGGKLYAFVQAAVLTLASVPTLAFQALHVPLHEIPFLAAVVFIAVMLFWWLVGSMSRDVSEPFSVAAAGRLTVILMGIASVAIYWHIIRSHRMFPGELKLPFPDAMLAIMQDLLNRESLLVELMRYAALLEAAPAWLVVRLDEYPLVGYVFAVYLALVCFLITSAAVAIAVFCKHYATKGVFNE